MRKVRLSGNIVYTPDLRLQPRVRLRLTHRIGLHRPTWVGEALVDTGCTGSIIIPQSVQEELQLPFRGVGVRRVGFANGETSDCPVHFVFINTDPPTNEDVRIEVLVFRRPPKNIVRNFWNRLWQRSHALFSSADVTDDDVFLGMKAMQGNKLEMYINFGASFHLDITDQPDES